MPTNIPVTADLNGTELRPRPAFKAIPAPVTRAGGADARARPDTIFDGRCSATAAGSQPDARHAGQMEMIGIAINRAAIPTPITIGSMRTPGDGSTSRARPIGVSGLATMATTVAAATATTAINAARTMPMVVSSLRVMPSARRTG